MIKDELWIGKYNNLLNKLKILNYNLTFLRVKKPSMFDLDNSVKACGLIATNDSLPKLEFWGTNSYFNLLFIGPDTHNNQHIFIVGGEFQQIRIVCFLVDEYFDNKYYYQTMDKLSPNQIHTIKMGPEFNQWKHHMETETIISFPMKQEAKYIHKFLEI